jgi:DNA repair protein RecO (recombination protein O)
LFQSIILKKKDWGEADELVVFFSRDLGWLHGIAKNAKRSRVRFGGHLEPLSLVDLTLRHRKKDGLVWIDESQVQRGFLGIRSEIVRVAQASYFLEVASIFLPEDQPDPAVFDFLLAFLETVEQGRMTAVLSLLEETRLLGLLGYAPRFDVCPACGKALVPGEEALFSPLLGGACHLPCVGPSEDRSLLLSPETLAVVRRGLQVDRGVATRLRLHRHGVDEARKALSSFVRHLRGEDVKSLSFLEKLAG